MTEFRTEPDSLGKVEGPAEKLWGAQTEPLVEFELIRSPDARTAVARVRTEPLTRAVRIAPSSASLRADEV